MGGKPVFGGSLNKELCILGYMGGEVPDRPPLQFVGEIPESTKAMNEKTNAIGTLPMRGLGFRVWGIVGPFLQRQPVRELRVGGSRCRIWGLHCDGLLLVGCCWWLKCLTLKVEDVGASAVWDFQRLVGL